MSPTALALAARLAALPSFQPTTRPGLRLVHPTEHGCFRVTDYVGRSHSPIVGVRPMFADEDGIPDLNDPATVGVLAAWCREVYGDPLLYSEVSGGWWSVRTARGVGGYVIDHERRIVARTTEGEAWAAALIAKLEEP